MKPDAQIAFVGEWLTVPRHLWASVFDCFPMSQAFLDAHKGWSWAQTKIGIDRDREGRVTLLTAAIVFELPGHTGWHVVRCEVISERAVRAAFASVGQRHIPALLPRPPVRRRA